MKYLKFITLLCLVTNKLLSQSFEESVQSYVNQLQLPSAAVAVAQGGNLIYFKGYGTTNQDDSERIGPDHIFGIASITKTFSAVTLQMAVREGKIYWDDKISKFPNQYFNSNRWDDTMTIGHLFSMTAESNPKGTNFVYNGSKFNLPFNVFQTLNSADNSTDITRRFTYEIDSKILKPLDMEHTLNKYDSIQILKIGSKIVIPHNFDEQMGTYGLQDFNFKFINSGPAFGMMSSVNDLIKYSNALNNETLLSKTDYAKITSPYYHKSPYGLGWFTTNLYGYDVHWAYGYGINDASILLKIPSQNLTFILLSNNTIPSASTRLGYGDPLNSLLVVSFIKQYLLHINDDINFNSPIKQIEKQVRKLNRKYDTDIFTKSLYARASLGLLLPSALKIKSEDAESLFLSYLRMNATNIDITSPLVFELLSKCTTKEFKTLQLKFIRKYQSSGFFHPSTAYFIGIILEKEHKTEEAIRFFKSVADDNFYNENADKFSAMFWLANYYKQSDTVKSIEFLRRLIKYKENISAFDSMYQEAKILIEALK